MSDTGWIWTDPHIVGPSASGEYESVYYWNRNYHRTREAAIKAGLRNYGSDDFNVAHIIDGELVWFGWMDEPLLEDLASVAAKLGFRVGEPFE